MISNSERYLNTIKYLKLFLLLIISLSAINAEVTCTDACNASCRIDGCDFGACFSNICECFDANDNPCLIA